LLGEGLEAVQPLTKRIEECFRGQQIGGHEPFCEPSMREVADALSISVANAKSRVHRGRLFLRKRLAMFGGGATAAGRASSQHADSRELFDDGEQLGAPPGGLSATE